MFLTFLQSIYNPHSKLPDDSEVYKHLIVDIEYFSISPQIYFLLKQQGRLESTPQVFQDRLKRIFDQVHILNLFIKHQTDIVLSTFDQLGILTIPLKGVLFAEKYFGHMGARSTSDIDLLIKHHDLNDAINSVKKLGFLLEEECAPGHFHCSFSKVLPGSEIPLTIELHWDILNNNTSEFDISSFWSKAVTLKQYKHIKELTDNHTFYMICLHAWRHNLDSMKHFLDIIQMINVLGEKIDYSKLSKEATIHKNSNKINRTLAIVFRIFPQMGERHNFPLQNRSGLWWQYEALRDPSFRNRKVYLDYFDFLFLSFDTFKHRYVAFKEWIYPSEYAVSQELKTNERIGIRDYTSLYKKRCYGMIRSLFLHK